MAIDSFLCFNQASIKVLGEAQDSVHKDTFHIKSFSFSIANKGSSVSGGGAGSGKAEFEDFEFTIDTQKGSSELMKHCAIGTHFDKIWLYVRKSGGGEDKQGKDYLKYRFENVMISSYSIAGEEDCADTVKFNFSGIFCEYFEQQADGKLASSSIKGGWDLKLNKTIIA